MPETEINKWESLSKDEINKLPENELAGIPENYPLWIINADESEAIDLQKENEGILDGKMGVSPQAGEAVWISFPNGNKTLAKVDSVMEVEDAQTLKVHLISQENK